MGLVGVVLAFGRRDGVSADRLLWAALTQRRQTPTAPRPSGRAATANGLSAPDTDPCVAAAPRRAASTDPRRRSGGGGTRSGATRAGREPGSRRPRPRPRRLGRGVRGDPGELHAALRPGTRRPAGRVCPAGCTRWPRRCRSSPAPTPSTCRPPSPGCAATPPGCRIPPWRGGPRPRRTSAGTRSRRRTAAPRVPDRLPQPAPPSPQLPPRNPSHPEHGGGAARGGADRRGGDGGGSGRPRRSCNCVTAPRTPCDCWVGSGWCHPARPRRGRPSPDRRTRPDTAMTLSTAARPITAPIPAITAVQSSAGRSTPGAPRRLFMTPPHANRPHGRVTPTRAASRRAGATLTASTLTASTRTAGPGSPHRRSGGRHYTTRRPRRPGRPLHTEQAWRCRRTDNRTEPASPTPSARCSMSWSVMTAEVTTSTSSSPTPPRPSMTRRARRPSRTPSSAMAAAITAVLLSPDLTRSGRCWPRPAPLRAGEWVRVQVLARPVSSARLARLARTATRRRAPGSSGRPRPCCGR